MCPLAPGSLPVSNGSTAMNGVRRSLDPLARDGASLIPSGDGVQRDILELSGPWTYVGGKLTFTIRLARVK